MSNRREAGVSGPVFGSRLPTYGEGEMVLQGFSLHITRYAPHRKQLPHAHDDLHLSIVLSGSVEESVGRHTELLLPLSIASKDPGVVHQNAWGSEGAVLARLSVSGMGLREMSGERALEAGHLWMHSVGIAAPFLRLVRRATGPITNVSTGDADLADLLAAVITKTGEKAGQPPAWLRDAMTLTREGWRPGLTVADVATYADVHPVYLARCVRRWYGTSLGNELRDVRLRHAVRALGREVQSVSSVAHRSGYADEPHLCRSFRGSIGLTPRALRRIVRQAANLAQPSLP